MKEKFIIEVSSPEASEYIQKLAFKAGCKWRNGDVEVSDTNCSHLYFNTEGVGRFCCSSENYHPDKPLYKFPEQAAEIVKLFENKKELVAGKWYHYNKSLLCYQGKANKLLLAFGLLPGGWSGVNTFGMWPEEWKAADPETIKAHLIKEAERRGFKEGVKFTAVRDLKVDDWGSNGIHASSTTSKRGKLYSLESITYKPDTDTLTCYGHGVYVLYEKGKWAEISSETEIKVGNHAAKIEDGEITIGDYSHDIEAVVSLKRAITKFRNAGDFSITAIEFKAPCGDKVLLPVSEIMLIAERGSK